MSIKQSLHPSLQLVWLIANSQAQAASSQMIEPIHFWLGTLLVLDEAFYQFAEQTKFSPKEIDEIGQQAIEAREKLGLGDSEITRLRRKVERQLGANITRLTSLRLHRSLRSRKLIYQAIKLARTASEADVTIVHMVTVFMTAPPEELEGWTKEEWTLPAEFAGTALEGGAPESAKPFAGAIGEKAREQILAEGEDFDGFIEKFGRDLTSLAQHGQLSGVVGREKEMTILARYLQRTSKRNVMIVGDAGVGKTALVEGLAQRLASERAPEFLRALRIVQLSVSDIMAGTKYRGDLETRLQDIIATALTDEHLILFLDEIHLVMQAGVASGTPVDIANMLKPALARDEFRCIGATTTEEFDRYVKRDPAFLRRFQLLQLGEPTEEESVAICRSWAERIGKQQDVVIDDDAVEAAVTLSMRYLRGRSLPDKAIDLLENAASSVRIASLTFSSLPDPTESPRVGREDIARVVEEQVGVPVDSDAFEPKMVERALAARVVGQSEAVDSIVEFVGSLSARNKDEDRPVGVLLFVGPSGVGKTFTAHTLESTLFPGVKRGAGRFNLSEFKERHELAVLIGAPPGFIGHGEQGALFRFAAGHSRGLILLDEADKAHPEILDFFLQIFDQGEALDPRGARFDFRHYLFVLTVTEDVTTQGRKIGFRDADASRQREQVEVEQFLAKRFRREFLGRIDRVVRFGRLGDEAYIEILNRLAADLADTVLDRFDLRVETSPDFSTRFLEVFERREEGVRGLARLFEQLVKSPLVEHILQGKATTGVALSWGQSGPVFG